MGLESQRYVQDEQIENACRIERDSLGEVRVPDEGACMARKPSEQSKTFPFPVSSPGGPLSGRWR